MNKEKVHALTFWLVVMLLGLAILAGVGWGAWRAMQHVKPNQARLWAMLATVALPVVTWIGWYFGHTEARGRLEGIDQAFDTVMGGAAQIAGLGLRTQRARDARPEPKPEPWSIELPSVEIMERRQLTSGDEVIEL